MAYREIGLHYQFQRSLAGLAAVDFRGKPVDVWLLVCIDPPGVTELRYSGLLVHFVSDSAAFRPVHQRLVPGATKSLRVQGSFFPRHHDRHISNSSHSSLIEPSTLLPPLTTGKPSQKCHRRWTTRSITPFPPMYHPGRASMSLAIPCKMKILTQRPSIPPS